LKSTKGSVYSQPVEQSARRTDISRDINGGEIPLKDIRREKLLIDIMDVEIFLKQLWMNKDVFAHEHRRVQTALLFLLLSFASSRPGVVIESSCYQHSKQP